MYCLISMYTYLFSAFSLKRYCFMICSGNVDRGIHMYSKRSNGLQRYTFLMSLQICLALMVLMMQLHSILEVFRSAVLVVSSHR